MKKNEIIELELNEGEFLFLHVLESLYVKYMNCINKNFQEKILNCINELNILIYPEEKLKNQDIVDFKVVQKIKVEKR